MTDIKFLKDRIIIDGHAETKQECETITLLCNNLAKSKDFKTVRYEGGYAEFEKVGKADELKFAAEPAAIKMVWDSHVTSVSWVNTSSGNSETESASWTTSGEEQTLWGRDTTTGIATVVLEEGYVLNTVTWEGDGAPIGTISGKNTFELGNFVNNVNGTATITTKQSGSSTGLTWLINDTPLMTPFTASKSIHIRFKSNNTNYTYIGFQDAGMPGIKGVIIDYSSPQKFVYDPSQQPAWENEAYKTIEFEETPTGEILEWLNANATKQATPTTKQQIDLSTLSGWANLSSGSHQITVKAKASGYGDSASSNAVSVEKAASGHAVTITAAAGSYGVKIYDGTSSSGTLLGTIADQDNTPKTVTCASSNLYLISDNGAYTDANTVVTGGVTIVSEGSWYYNGTFKVTADGTITISLACLIEGTQITLADGTTKAVEDITYDDELLVWNFYAGRFDKAKPTWIKVAEVAPRYNLVKFSNGAEVGFVGAGGEKGYHRIFNKEAGAFTHTGCKDTPNGTTTFAQDKTFPTVVSQEVVEKEVKFYNVITDKHYNLFANGILTSCKLSNKYRIEDMRYIGERLISDEQEKAYFERI